MGYHGDGKCSRPVFGRRETCSGNNREDGCCSIDKICEFYSRLPDFKDHYEDFKGVFGNFTCEESTTFSPSKTTTLPVQGDNTTKLDDLIITTAPTTTVVPENKSSTKTTATTTASIKTSLVKSDIVTNTNSSKATPLDLSPEYRFEMLIEKLRPFVLN